MKKKLALSVAAAALVGTLAVGGTLAYFTDTETATNTIETGNVNVKITETYDKNITDARDGYDVVKINANGNEGLAYTNVEPGVKIVKDPVITYTGTTKGYVRYKVQVNVVAASDATEEQRANIANLASAVEFYKGTEKLNLKLDQYYYARKDSGNTTSMDNDLLYSDLTKTEKMGAAYTSGNEVIKVFDSVRLSNTLGNDAFKGLGKIEINVIADAIQADNLNENNPVDPTLNDVYTAFGTGEVPGFSNDGEVVEKQ